MTEDATVSIDLARTNYENVAATCPACGSLNVYNRISDLNDTRPIANRRVRCQAKSCGTYFQMAGDRVDAGYEMMISSCGYLVTQKLYMYSILTLCQAHEMFFAQYLRVQLLFRPFAKGEPDVDELNRLALSLYEKTKMLTYVPLLSIFLNLVLVSPRIDGLSEAEDVIRDVDVHRAVPSDESIRQYSKPDVQTRLLKLKRSRINELRNQVVHQRGYRPTREEVEEAIDETRGTILILGHDLDVWADEPNWYSHG